MILFRHLIPWYVLPWKISNRFLNEGIGKNLFVDSLHNKKIQRVPSMFKLNNVYHPEKFESPVVIFTFLRGCSVLLIAAEFMNVFLFELISSALS